MSRAWRRGAVEAAARERGRARGRRARRSPRTAARRAGLARERGAGLARRRRRTRRRPRRRDAAATAPARPRSRHARPRSAGAAATARDRAARARATGGHGESGRTAGRRHAIGAGAHLRRTSPVSMAPRFRRAASLTRQYPRADVSPAYHPRPRLHISTDTVRTARRRGQRTAARMRTPSASRVRRLGGEREPQVRRGRLGREPRAAGEHLHAGAVGALGQRDVVLARVEPDPDVQPAARRRRPAGAELAVDRGERARRGARAARRAGA